MISKKNTMSVCNCIRELLEESYTCGRAALGGGGGGGAAGGGGGGGGGTGMPRPQIPGEDKAHSIAGNPVCSASRVFYSLRVRRSYCVLGAFDDLSPSSPEQEELSPPYSTKQETAKRSILSREI